MDEIKRKLDQIDRQMTELSLNGRLIRVAPLFLPTVGLMLGILVQACLSRSLDEVGPTFPWLWITLLVLFAIGTFVETLRHRERPRPEIVACGAMLCFACLGAVRWLDVRTPAPSDVRRLVGTDRQLATIQGRVLTEPQPERRDWCFACFLHTDLSTSFYMRLDRVKSPDGWQPVSGTVRVQVNEPTLNVRVGDRIQAYCWLHRFQAPTNPGQFDVARYLAARNVYIGASVPLREAIEVNRDRVDGLVARIRRRLGNSATAALLGHGPADEPHEGLLEALLLGQRGNIDRQTYQAFRRTGLLHFISLSGLHLGILAGTLWWLCKTAGLLKPARAVVCIIATAVFLLTVPPRAPTIRAAIIVWVYCVSVLVRRRPSPLNALCLAAILLLLRNPADLFEPGWQLSFASVAGVLALTHRVEHIISAIIHRGPQREQRRTSGPAAAVKHLSNQALGLFSTGVAAWIGGAGILLYHFYSINPLASLWTVLVFPLVAAILILGLFKIILFFILPTLSNLLGLLVSSLADLLVLIVKGIAPFKLNALLIGHVAVWVVVFYYALVVVGAFLPTRRPRLKNWLCMAMILMLVGYLGGLKWRRTHRNDLSLTVLDVGHGQAILARLPGTTNLLFDGGSLYTHDVGTRIILPFLDYIGIERLHAIVISHHDIDHINGLPEVAGGRRVDHVYGPDALLSQSETVPTARLLKQHLLSERLAIEPAPKTLRIGPTHIQTLWPPDPITLNDHVSDNDLSLVSLIQFADVRILLCSDIEEFAQHQIMGRNPELKANVMVLPHHGSARTLDRAFLTNLAPEIAIASCSRADLERGRIVSGNPAGKIFHTAENGAITVCVETAGVVTVNVRTIQTGD